VPTQRILALIATVIASGCAACTKESASTVDTGAVGASDRAGSGGGSATVLDTSPLPGVDVAKLDKKRQEMFYRLVASLGSPCGKAHSLRTSVVSDTSCRRAPFAAKLVMEMLSDEASEADIKEEYRNKYESKAPPKELVLATAPRSGPADAPIVIVEFFDYECGACQAFKPELEKVAKQYPADVAVYYKMFPLSQHKDSKSAAQAAVAAHRQGKFHEMHEVLFARSPAHTRADVMAYARELGLDLAKFETDYAAAAAVVEGEIAEGSAVGVDHTPTMFFNGMEYQGPTHSKYLGLWVEEEIAVNR
jgi:protein-disulfide isomerase